MTKPKQAIKTKPGIKTVADFRALHDPSVIVPTRIRKALADMLAEHPESWAYEADFLARAGVANSAIGNFRDMFIKHIVETRGKLTKRVWFASPKVAATIRG